MGQRSDAVWVKPLRCLKIFQSEQINLAHEQQLPVLLRNSRLLLIRNISAVSHFSVQQEQVHIYTADMFTAEKTLMKLVCATFTS